MISWGIAAGTHDGSLAVIDDDKILFASHTERYSRVKNDAHLNQEIIEAALHYGEPSEIYWYEKPMLKALRKFYAGQSNIWMNPRKYLKSYGIKKKINYVKHHDSHAAAGFSTSPFDSAAVLVIDAIGEFTTTSISHYTRNEKSFNSLLLHEQGYPFSLGLFYSAITDKAGLKPNEEEYILMGMSAYGRARWTMDMRFMLHNGFNFHKGCRRHFPEANPFDLAKSAQIVYEEEFLKLVKKAKDLTDEKNIVIMGGCALNCLANTWAFDQFENVWIMPNPGDAGSSIGAYAAGTGKMLDWKTPYLGEDIGDGKYPVKQALDELLENKIVGVASGRAEFGPRALGNRSLLADPTGQEMKDVVNKIKKRQEFRPFAPVILQSDVHKYFNVQRGFSSPYMQYIVYATEPEKYPAIVHADGSSRVQTVTKEQHPGLWRLLTQYKKHTGTPMLLNTSLNIKGEPMVNSRKDADNFEERYSVKVVS
jgi:carbamoyltransferase